MVPVTLNFRVISHNVTIPERSFDTVNIKPEVSRPVRYESVGDDWTLVLGLLVDLGGFSILLL